MRTTLDVDDDVLALARGLAEARKISIGKAISSLARRGATARVPLKVKNGFHVFSLEERAPSFGPEEVAAALESEDLRSGDSFWKPHP
jgi:hypothetical protein